MTLSVYAELLPNIRQISLAISSDMPLTFDESLTYGNISASIEHHEDICCVLGVYGGLSFCHILPGRVACPGGYELPAPPRSGDGKVATWRLPLLDDGRGPGEAGSGVPWEAKDLGPGSEVSCRKCRASLVGKDGVTEWKDLPAEGWAEMMEFWHCHKPGEEHGHGHGQEEGDGAVVGEQRKADEQSLASRGYGAASSISAQKGVGFVDLTTFLFEEGDCQGITFSPSSFGNGSTSRNSLPEMTSTNLSSGLNIFCTSCQTRIGYFNYKTNAVTLLKWQVSCQTKTLPQSWTRNRPPPTRPPPTVSHCLATTLAATLARTGSSKSLLLPIPGLAPPTFSTPPAQTLHFWILNPSLKYTSSLTERQAGRTRTEAIPAMKLLYRMVSKEEADKMLEDVNSDVQEAHLPEEAIEEVRRVLEESGKLLPVAESRYKEWTVGLLGRWE